MGIQNQKTMITFLKIVEMGMQVTTIGITTTKQKQAKYIKAIKLAS